MLTLELETHSDELLLLDTGVLLEEVVPENDEEGVRVLEVITVELDRE